MTDREALTEILDQLWYIAQHCSDNDENQRFYVDQALLKLLARLDSFLGRDGQLLSDRLEELYAEVHTAGFWQGVKCFFNFLEAYSLVIAMWDGDGWTPIEQIEDAVLEEHFELLRQNSEEAR